MGERPRRVYVASSWRNVLQPTVVAALRSAGHEVYDFRHPAEGNDGFHWSEVMPSYRRVGPGSPEQLANADEYIEALSHPIAVQGFKSDFDAMQWADTCVLVLPCGRSAHLELGWFVGQGRRTAILLDGPAVTPELMYKMVDYVAPTLADLRCWLEPAMPLCPTCPDRSRAKPVAQEIEGRVLVCDDCAADDTLRDHARGDWR